LSPDGYAPLGLTLDAASIGLERSEVAGPFGTAIAYSKRTAATTRATIFLHGAAGSWTTWTPLLETAKLSGVPIVNPVLLDLPGWGDATISAAGESAAIDAVCTLVKYAAEQLGFTEWDIVGHSMGGFIALHMASIWPECVLSVGTVSATTWSVIDVVAHPVRHFGRLPGFVALWRVMQGLSHLGRGGTALVRGVRTIGLLRAATSPLFRHPTRIPRSVIHALGDELRPRSFSIAVEIARGYDATARWSGIECPVRAMQGDRDVFARPGDLDGLAAILPDSVREIVADCGHFGLIERPAEVLAALGFGTTPVGV
jgi:pimeloyl-ACP methyl ester carboxylesterase